MPRVFAAAAALAVVLTGCAPQVSPSLPHPAAAPHVRNVTEAPAPAAGAVTTEEVHESEHMVSRIMRIAPGGTIAEHHHPAHDENLIVYRGQVTAFLNDRRHELRPGDVVFIPAGTVIRGLNEMREEAVVVVVFTSVGRGGPLTVPGRPAHH